MQDLCHAVRYIRMSSNPTGDCLIKFFPHSLFVDVYFHVFYYFLRIVFFFFFFFCVFCCCIVLYCIVLYCIVLYCVFNIAMKFQDASCPSLAVGVLSSSVEPPS